MYGHLNRRFWVGEFNLVVMFVLFLRTLVVVVYPCTYGPPEFHSASKRWRKKSNAKGRTWKSLLCVLHAIFRIQTISKNEREITALSMDVMTFASGIWIAPHGTELK